MSESEFNCKKYKFKRYSNVSGFLAFDKNRMSVGFDEVCSYITSLENQLDQYEKGFKGACPTCEVVGEFNGQLASQLNEANELLKKANNYGGCEFKEINMYFQKYSVCNKNNTIV